LDKLEEDNDRGRAEQLGQGGIYVVVETAAEGRVSAARPCSGALGQLPE
jgi:hypothetical protein